MQNQENALVKAKRKSFLLLMLNYKPSKFKNRYL